MIQNYKIFNYANVTINVRDYYLNVLPVPACHVFDVIIFLFLF